MCGKWNIALAPHITLHNALICSIARTYSTGCADTGQYVLHIALHITLNIALVCRIALVCSIALICILQRFLPPTMPRPVCLFSVSWTAGLVSLKCIFFWLRIHLFKWFSQGLILHLYAHNFVTHSTHFISMQLNFDMLLVSACLAICAKVRE